MQAALTPDDVFAHVMMLRGVDSRLVLLVEGPSDCGLLDPHIDDEHLQTVPGHGKSTVLAACHLIEERGVAGVAGLVDLDFDDLTGLAELYPACVFATSSYDLDADFLLACPTSVDRLAATHRDWNRAVAEIDRLGYSTVFELVVALAGELGLLRLTAALNDWSVSLDGVLTGEVVTAYLTSPEDLSALLTIQVARRAGAPDLTIVEGQHAAVRATAPPLARAVRTHDLARGLAALVRSWGGSVGGDACEKALRMAFDCVCLQRLKLAQDIGAWALRTGAQAWRCEAISA